MYYGGLCQWLAPGPVPGVEFKMIPFQQTSPLCQQGDDDPVVSICHSERSEESPSFEGLRFFGQWPQNDIRHSVHT